MTRRMGQNRTVGLFAYRHTFDRPDNCTNSHVLLTGMPTNSAVLPGVPTPQLYLHHSLSHFRHRLTQILTPNDYPQLHTERQWRSAAAATEAASCQLGRGPGNTQNMAVWATGCREHLRPLLTAADVWQHVLWDKQLYKREAKLL